MSESFVGSLAEKNPDVILFLDIPADQEYDKIKTILERVPETKIAILDHHIFERNMNHIGILHINPRFRDKRVYIPASYIVYRIIERLGLNVKPLIWIACMGIIGDYGVEDCIDIIEECKMDYPHLLKGDPMRSRLSDGAKIISSTVTLKGLKGAEICLDILKKCSTYEDFIRIKKLREWRNIVDEEIKSLIDGFEREKEVYEPVIFYKITTRLSLTSVISTILSERYPDSIVVIRKKSGSQWKISVRNQSGEYNVGEIVKKSVQGIGSGGGHEKAAAGIVSKWRVFKKRLLDEVGKYKSIYSRNKK
ncbi:MAG TPA: DHH family phosphoesterase [Candidatus Aenigmarchaeota archaeon]|nr:DHH family phosphoesterase [Candidatus Aenigmarchaeota archaeon]